MMRHFAACRSEHPTHLPRSSSAIAVTALGNPDTRRTSSQVLPKIRYWLSLGKVARLRDVRIHPFPHGLLQGQRDSRHEGVVLRDGLVNRVHISPVVCIEEP